jgi:hypothetical protein
MDAAPEGFFLKLGYRPSRRGMSVLFKRNHEAA